MSLRGFVIGIAIGLGVLASAAQAHYKPHISVGGRAGVSLSRQDLSPHVSQKFNLGTTGAVTVRYAEEKLFGIVAEFGWIQRGWKENFEESPLRYSRTLTYVNMPIMTQIIFGGRRAKCFINLGPEFGYMIGEKITANFDYNDLGSVTDWPERVRHKEQLGLGVKNKFDYGITAGVGGEFYLSPRNSVTLEARYYYGLGNIFSDKKADPFSASRCTSIDICIGYNFRIK